jgi:hypothetical protein
LAPDDAKNLFQERDHALREAGTLTFDERAVERGVDVAVNRPADLLDLRVGEIAEAVRGVEAQPTLSRDLDLLHERHVDVHARPGQAEAWSRGDRHLGIRWQERRRRDACSLRPQASAPRHDENRRVLIRVRQNAPERDVFGRGGVRD